MMELVDIRDLKSLAFGVPVRVRVGVPTLFACSSTVEPAAHNGYVVSSNLAGQTNF